MKQPTSTMQQWQGLKAFLTTAEMTPQRFLALHPEFSREQLASMMGCHIDTVHCWFATGAHHRNPSASCRRLLGLAHWYLTQQAAAPGLFQILQAMEAKR